MSKFPFVANSGVADRVGIVCNFSVGKRIKFAES